MRSASNLDGDDLGWGAEMPKRFRDMLLGNEDAVPGDYVLALVATVGLFLAVLLGMIV